MICIRTRIVKVYQGKTYQETSWAQYSYKICYGLSEDGKNPIEWTWLLSYKICYGLSIVNKRLKKIVELSYKICYGLSLVKSRFVISSIA